MANSKVVIDIIAQNSRTFNMLEFVLQQHGKGRFELSRGNRPELVVVDFDKSDVNIAFRKYRSRFPDIPAVFLLNQQEEYEALPSEERIGAEFLLLKPFAAKDFIAKINECLCGIPAIQSGGNSEIARTKTSDQGSADKGLRSSPRSTTANREGAQSRQASVTALQVTRPGTRPRTWEALEDGDIGYSFALESEIDMADAAAVEKVWLTIDSKLLGYVKNAIARQVPAQSVVCLSVNDGVSLYISTSTKTVAVVGDKFDLVELARRDFSNGQISTTESAMPDKNIQLQLELEAFLWKLALYTYRGFLPAGVNVNKPVYLKYWPNLTRLEPTPNAMRIASLWSRQPVAIAFVVRILNIPQRHVFNYFAAANAIGFAGPAVREVDNMLLPSYPDERSYSTVQGYVDTSTPRNKIT